MTVQRFWMPADWLDEEGPVLSGVVPEAFIRTRDDGTYELRELKHDVANAKAEEPGDYQISMTDGDIVKFCWHEHYGTIVARKHEDGRVTNHSKVSPQATLFYIEGEPETLSITPKDALDAVEPGTYTLEAYHWSAPLPFQFHAEDESFQSINDEGGNG